MTHSRQAEERACDDPSNITASGAIAAMNTQSQPGGLSAFSHPEILDAATRIERIACFAIAALDEQGIDPDREIEEIAQIFRPWFRAGLLNNIMHATTFLNINQDVPGTAALIRNAAEYASSTPDVARPGEAPNTDRSFAHANTFMLQVTALHAGGQTDARGILTEREGFVALERELGKAFLKSDPTGSVHVIPYLYSTAELNHVSFQALNNVPAHVLQSAMTGVAADHAALLQISEGDEQLANAFPYEGPMVRYVLGLVWSNSQLVRDHLRDPWPQGTPERFLVRTSAAVNACVADKEWHLRVLGADNFFESLRNGARHERCIQFLERFGRLAELRGIDGEGCFYEIKHGSPLLREKCPILYVFDAWLSPIGEIAWPALAFEDPIEQVQALSRLAQDMQMRSRSDFIVPASAGTC